MSRSGSVLELAPARPPALRPRPPSGHYRGSHRSDTPRARGRAAIPGRIVALIPAHDEAEAIGTAVRALRDQTRPPDRILVVADNCADDTALLAVAAGAEVMTTSANRHRKAGALNQALARVLPTLRPSDRVLVLDADSVLDPDFVDFAAAHLERDRRLGAVGGIFRGGAGGGLVGHLQRNEYARYGRDVRRLRGRCLVVTGTAALFRAEALREVSTARRVGRLPTGDGAGGVYDTTVLTEDNELTFALLHLGYAVSSPRECTLVTEVMPTWRDLWRQRLRWKRGAVENCVQYGLTRVTRAYWGRQALAAVGILVTAGYLGSLLWSLVALQAVHVQPFWLAVTGVFALERVVTVRDRGWLRMVAAASMYELVFDLFLQAVHAKAYADALLRRERTW